MCQQERLSLQRGMNFRLRDGASVILMSRRAGAPYADAVEEDGRVLIYEGHDVPAQLEGRLPKASISLGLQLADALLRTSSFTTPLNAQRRARRNRSRFASTKKSSRGSGRITAPF